MGNQFIGGFEKKEKIQAQYDSIDLPHGTAEHGGIPLISDAQKMTVCGDESHTLIISSSGTGKTRRLLMPAVFTLGMAGENMVVTDPKGEILAATGSFLKRTGYRIITLNYRDMGVGECYNPMTRAWDLYHDGKRDEAFEEIENFVGILQPQLESGEVYWQLMATALCKALMQIMLEICTREEYNPVSLAKMCTHTGIESIRQIVEQLPHDCVTYVNLQSVLYAPREKTLPSIVSTLYSALAQFLSNHRAAVSMSHMTWSFDELTTRKKTALFIILPDEKNNYNFIASVLVKQIYTYLTEIAYKTGGRLSTRMNFILDEFGNIPAIPDFGSMISASRSRNIRFFLGVQDLHQLRSKYEDTAETITGNCNNIVYMHTKETDLLEKISNLCGEKMLPSGKVVELLSPFELQHLRMGEVLMLLGRNLPFLTMLPDISEYIKFQSVDEEYCEKVNKPVAEDAEIEVLDIGSAAEDIENGKMAVPFTNGKLLKNICELDEDDFDEIRDELEQRFSDLFGDDDDDD